MTKLNISILLLVLMLLVGLTATETTAQLTLEDTETGFTGEYESGAPTLLVEYDAESAESTVSKITNSSNQTIVESLREDNVVTVTIDGITITITMDSDDPEDSTISSLSPMHAIALEAFRTSEGSGPVRELIIELLKQKSSEPTELRGFYVIAMILGDGPGAPAEDDSEEAKTNCSDPKLVQMYASYNLQSPQNPNLQSPQKLGPQSQQKFGLQHEQKSNLQNQEQPKDSNVFTTTTSIVNRCMGCCGAGCWGCTGCYTGACYAHDVCVGDWGYYHWRCMGLLAAAVASMHYQCLLF